MKVLNGSDLAGFIKQRQARQVRHLRQSKRIFPKLAIISTDENPVIDTYMRLKKSYGEDILIEVDIYKVAQTEAAQLIKQLNDDTVVHGIIIQLPLADPTETDELANLVAPEKDVDGLGAAAKYDPATPMAINWLLAGYNIDLKNKQLAIVGQGRLVGAPLTRMWRNSGLTVTAFDENNQAEMKRELENYDLIVTATGVAGLITSDLVKFGACLVDAGTASEHGKIVGDVAPEVRQRDDVTITPEKGGVGPLTIAALFDNLIRAAEN